MKVSIFKNFNNIVENLPILTVLDQIRDGKYRDKVADLRSLITASQKEEYDIEKKKMLAFTPSGTFEGGRKLEYFLQYSSLLILDIDKLPPDELDIVKRKAIDNSLTFACFVSPSELGIKILIKVDSKPIYHKQAFDQVKEYYEKVLSVPVDKSGKDITRLCFFSYDDNLYINSYSETFKTMIAAVDNDVDYVVQQIEQNQIDITSSYNDWVKIGYALIDALGAGAKEFFHRVSKFYPGYDSVECDDLFGNLLKAGKPPRPVSAKTFFYLAKDYGIDITPVSSYDLNDYQAQNQKPEKKEKEKTTKRTLNIDKIEQFIKSRYNMRFNIVTGNIEFKKRDQPDFKPMSDYAENSIYRELHKNKISCSISNLRNIINSDFCPRFDPFLNYFNSLPEWDGQSDYIAELASTVATTNDELWSYCLKKWIIASVASLLDEKTVNHTAIIFSGSQGIGKTMWMENLCPLILRAHLFSGTINPNNKDTLVQLSECWFINMDELENMNRTEIGTLKEIITKSAIRIRRAYGHNNENMIRRASFMGSVNTVQFLNDTTGSRRFLCFDVNQIDYKHKVDLSGVYSQALALYKDGFRFYFDQKEIILITTSNEQFQIHTIEEELLLTYFAPATVEDATNFYSASQILSKIAVYAKITISTGAAISMGKALKKHGFVKTKRNGTTLWAVQELTFDQVEAKSKNSLDTPPF